MHFINLSLFILSFLCNYIFATTDLFDTALEIPTKCKNGIRHRVEWRLFPEQGRRKYLEAILKLQSRSGDNPSDYDKMAQIHGDNAKQLHSGSSFLPWHRLFIYKFETMIQTVMGDPKFAIPFWAWQLDASTPHTSDLWSEKYYGGNGEGSDNCVCKGVFKDWKPMFPDASPCLKRDFKGDDVGAIGPFESMENINAIVSMSSAFDDFRRSIEILPHGVVHNNIGGNMRSMYSPNDPVFYLHHANIDQLYYRWQSYRSTRFSAYDGSNPDSSNAAIDDDLLCFPGWKVEDVFDVKKLCYDYSVPSADDVAETATILPDPDIEVQVEEHTEDSESGGDDSGDWGDDWGDSEDWGDDSGDSGDWGDDSGDSGDWGDDSGDYSESGGWDESGGGGDGGWGERRLHRRHLQVFMFRRLLHHRKFIRRTDDACVVPAFTNDTSGICKVSYEEDCAVTIFQKESIGIEPPKSIDLDWAKTNNIDVKDLAKMMAVFGGINSELARYHCLPPSAKLFQNDAMVQLVNRTDINFLQLCLCNTLVNCTLDKSTVTDPNLLAANMIALFRTVTLPATELECNKTESLLGLAKIIGPSAFPPGSSLNVIENTKIKPELVADINDRLSNVTNAQIGDSIDTVLQKQLEDAVKTKLAIEAAASSTTTETTSTATTTSTTTDSSSTLTSTTTSTTTSTIA